MTPVVLVANTNAVMSINIDNVLRSEAVRIGDSVNVTIRFTDGHIVKLKSADFPPLEFDELMSRLFKSSTAKILPCEDAKGRTPLDEKGATSNIAAAQRATD